MSYVVDHLVSAMNARDLAATMRCYSPQAVVVDGAQAEGLEEIADCHMHLFEGFPALRMTVWEKVVCGDLVMIEALASGTHGGPFLLAGGEVLCRRRGGPSTSVRAGCSPWRTTSSSASVSTTTNWRSTARSVSGSLPRRSRSTEVPSGSRSPVGALVKRPPMVLPSPMTCAPRFERSSVSRPSAPGGTLPHQRPLRRRGGGHGNPPLPGRAGAACRPPHPASPRQRPFWMMRKGNANGF